MCFPSETPNPRVLRSTTYTHMLNRVARTHCKVTSQAALQPFAMNLCLSYIFATILAYFRDVQISNPLDAFLPSLCLAWESRGRGNGPRREALQADGRG